MEPVDKTGIVYEFGRFLLDPQEKTLLVDGRPVHLPAKEFETLLLLVENNRKALSKEQMMSAVWQDSYVEEGNLAKQVSRLRKVLESDGEQFIETIPKHGYRFTADVRLSHGTDEPVVLERRTVRRMTLSVDDGGDVVIPPVEPGALPSAVGPNRSASIYVLFGVAALGLIVAGIFYFSRPGAQGGSHVRSLAVLPFQSVGSDDENFRLGLTDAVITKVSSLKQVTVRPTNAVRKYDGQEPVGAARELGVDAVLTGNIQRTGEQVRVTTQLVDVRDGRVLWASTVDERFTDIFRVQDAIAEQVAGALQPGLTGEERTLIAKRYTTNPEAHYAYVRGRFFWNKRTAADFHEAVKHFNEAIEKDPNYALAYSGLADSYSLLADYRGMPADTAYANARQAAEKALSLDADLAEAHTSLAYVKMYSEWDWPGTETGYRRAIELNPNYATGHQWYSEYLAAMGRFDEALTEIRRAKEIDPLSSVINAGEVWILYYARRYDEAIEHGRRLTEMNPQFAEVHEYLKRCYDQKGMYRDAINSRQMRRRLVGIDATMTEPMRKAAAATRHEEYWRFRLDQEIADSKVETPSTFDLAEIYAQLGEKDKAFEWLDKAFAERTYTMMYLKVAPNLDPLRSDPRFADMLRRVGLQNEN